MSTFTYSPNLQRSSSPGANGTPPAYPELAAVLV